MNLDRMVFAPGDKVMRVSGARGGGTPLYCGPDTNRKPVKFGTVYCVSAFNRGRTYNYVMLVGFGGWRYFNGRKVGFYAGAFRKVEEIQLCVKAAQQMKDKKLQAV